MQKKFEFQLVRANVRVRGKVVGTLTFLGNDRGVGCGVTILVQTKADHRPIVNILNAFGYIRSQLGDGVKINNKGAGGECMAQIAISTPRGVRVPQHFLTSLAREIGRAIKNDHACEKIIKELEGA